MKKIKIKINIVLVLIDSTFVFDPKDFLYYTV
jgi:hypothetical protein